MEQWLSRDVQAVTPKACDGNLTWPKDLVGVVMLRILEWGRFFWIIWVGHCNDKGLIRGRQEGQTQRRRCHEGKEERERGMLRCLRGRRGSTYQPRNADGL